MAALCRMKIALQTRGVVGAGPQQQPTSTLTFWGAASCGMATDGCAHPVRSVFMQTVTNTLCGVTLFGTSCFLPRVLGTCCGELAGKGTEG